MKERTYRNWYIVAEEGIHWLYCDREGSSTNALSRTVLRELDSILKVLSVKQVKGLVILSAKRNGFIAGADIAEFTSLEDHADAEKLIQGGQAVFDRLERMPFPTVSLIHGFCLGGGLELALSCLYRVAEDGVKTRFGLPEVKLGIHPGFGGTVRLPRLIGAPAAMDLILSGRTIDVHRAKKYGIVDYAVPDRHLKDMAVKCITDRPPVHRPPLLLRLTNHSPVRPVLKKIILKKTEARVNPEHYPAPFAALELWGHFAHMPQTMLAEEARSVARLITGNTAQNLVRVFFLRDRLKAQAKGVQFNASHVHVIGAGTMGGDIAAWCALQGYTVTLQARKPQSIAAAMKKAHTLFRKRMVLPRLARNTMDRLMPDIRGSGLTKADIVIEAISEDIALKQNLFQEIEPQVRKDALLATNTSSIPLESISSVLDRPERLVGLHFFNPVAKMPLVEIVAGKATKSSEVEKAMAFTKRIDRLPLPVKSAPGFLVNRILMPYLLEAVQMLEEGVAPSVIDKAATDFGMPMGPVLLADTVGLDICLHAAETMTEEFGIPIPALLQEKVDAGSMGKKSGRGLHFYKKGKPVASPTGNGKAAHLDIEDRLILRMVNEAVSCLEEGIAEDADLIDAAMVFGAGFAPFRGGLLHYCRTEGTDKVLEELDRLEKAHGERFHPSPGWKQFNETG